MGTAGEERGALSVGKSIRVLRIGHRYVRDYRTLTHLCLVSRALGAEAVYLEEIDDGLLEGIQEVNESWGSGFQVLQVPSWKSAVSEAKKEGRTVIHLTMYGMPVQEKVEEMRQSSKLLVAVGGPKVPAEAYQMADYNIAVTSQPHSEIAALAIVLHELQSGEELKKEFGPAKLKIIPSEKGKRVEKLA